ncbi:MAG: TRAP transporter permease, partial [Halobacteriota archaeon]
MSTPDRPEREEGGIATEEPSADPDDLLEEVENRRRLGGWAAILLAVVAVAFSAFQMWIAARSFVFQLSVPLVGVIRLGSLQPLQVNAIHVSFALILAFLMYPSSTGDGPLISRVQSIPESVRDQLDGDSAFTVAADRLTDTVGWILVDRDRRRVTPLDVVFILLTLVPPYYMVTEFDEIRDLRRFGLDAGRPLGEVYPALNPIAVGPLADTSWAFIVGIIGILLILEATRRALGLLLMGLIILFIVYARLGFMLPRGLPFIGTFAITDLGWSRIVRNLWFNTEAGINGRIVAVSVRFIYIFILFGAFLEMSGAGKWFIDLAYSMTGTRRGGPAKASVVSSGFMGMLSGSSVANTVTTGAFTIPLMKKSGYSSVFSGAVESSVSSGGQILPPVMGAAAFLIVEFTGTPYRDVIIAATLPALAFFFGMWVMVHFEAVRQDIGGLDRADLLDIGPHLVRGWFYLVPIGLLLYYLVIARLSIN